jgi:outer membrane protein TolC
MHSEGDSLHLRLHLEREFMLIARSFGVPAMMLILAGALPGQTPGASGQANQASPQSISFQSADSGATQNPLMGGIPTGNPTGGVLPLSLSDVIKRGLIYNLGIVMSEQTARAAGGARLLALSRLLPQVSIGASEMQEQVNLEAFGFSGFSGMKTIVGPFNVFDVRAAVSQAALDFTSLNRYRAETQNVKAAQFSNKNTRDMVVYVCSNLYLQAIASSNRIDAAKAQVNTAQVLYDLAVDQKAAGVVSGIEVLRAQVELQAQQQRLIVVEDQFQKDKLTIARAIGLPLGQEFSLTEALSYAPLVPIALDEAIQRAYRDRPDYQSFQARVQSAEFEKKAAKAERLPTVDFSADYGDIGQRPWDSHGTFTVATSLRIPIFTGGSIHGRILEADAVLNQRKAELEDLKGRIYYDIRTAFLDLQAAADRVQVAQSAIKLANEQVQQSQDRFRAGVTNNVEVVQAQEALATASENYISSLQAHSAAKLALARAIGVSDVAYEQFLRGK